jgi:phosphoribosyl 1,2-cyclic phosphodiesterase
MDIKFWGVRGSIPSPGPNTAQFGGNTPCVEVRCEGEPLIVLDSGTGIRKLGMSLLSDPDVSEVHLFFSHTHWDHIQGLPFFIPLFNPKFKIRLYGPVHYSKNLEEILSQQMEYTYFPVRVEELAADMSFHDITEQEVMIGGGIKVTTKFVNHPVVCLAYRIEHNGKSFVYMTDHEPYRNLFADADEADREEGRKVAKEQTDAIIQFVKGADVLCIDAQYTFEEYRTKVGWGHSSLDDSYALAQEGNVKEMVVFHHDPDRTDAELQRMVRDLQDRSWNPHMETIAVRLAKEQLVITL